MKLGEAIEILFATGIDLTDLDEAVGTILIPNDDDTEASPEYIEIDSTDLTVEGDATAGNLLWTTTDETFDPATMPPGQYRGFLLLTFDTDPVVAPKTKTFVLHLKSDYEYP